MVLEENLKQVKKRILAACGRVGRGPIDVRLVAVTKEVKPELIVEGIDLGIKEIGENRVQEARSKFDCVKRNVVWHMIGHLQRNKVKAALELFDMIQGVDSLRLAEEISKRADRVVGILAEVNTSGEATKFGIEPEQTYDLVKNIIRLPNLRLMGLMTIGPGWAITDPEASRPCFRLLVDLKKKIEDQFSISLPILSMGMSSDFEVAIEEGSTMVRVGSAIFGPRCRWIV